MVYEYKTRGTCSSKIRVELKDGIIQDVRFTGGCNGNTKGLAMLVKGCKAQEIIDRLDGILCGPRSTSCPDQLAKALREALAAE